MAIRREFTAEDRAYKATDLPRVDVPTAGFYVVRLVKNGPRVPVFIWHGAPMDPETGELLDRSPRWQALRGGKQIDIDEVWPSALKEPITEDEYDHLMAVKAWAERYAPHSPEANPTKPIDLHRLPSIF